MKKIIAAAVAAICLASASFALDFGIGGKAIAGKSVSGLNDVTNQIKADPNYDFGGGAYLNLSLFGGLGVQAEANVINSSISISKDGIAKGESYNTLSVDLAPMLWLNLNLWKLSLGAGVGPNFNIKVGALSDLLAAEKDQFKMGLATGADLKFYITKHLGLVVSGRYVMEFNKTEVPVEVAGMNTGINTPTIEYTRKNVYGGVGLEYKLF